MKYFLRLTLTLLLITAVVAGLLGLVNYMTEDTIAGLTAEKARAAMEQVLPAEEYRELAPAQGITGAWKADDKGYVVRLNAQGFGGAIDLMVGVDLQGLVTGIAVVSHAETASLGAECTRADWQAQFVGQGQGLAVEKDGGQVDSITGATVTSRAVANAVNAALAYVKEVQG